MKTVLVTGGAGFIGSHVVERLQDAEYRVLVADNLSTGRREHVAPGTEFHLVDVTTKGLHDLMERVLPDAIIHLAAQVSVAGSVKDPLLDASVNVLGTLNLLEAARACGVEHLLFASSAAVYGTPKALPILESAELSPLSPYAITKLAAERYVETYCDLYGLRAVITRYANVYGPRQLQAGDGGVVARFVERIAAGKSPVFHGDGAQSRDFIYVKDVAEANLLALQYLFGSDEPGCLTLNVSTGERHSLIQLYALLRNFAPAAPEPLHAEARAGDIRHSCLDNRKAVRHLGWSPRTTLEQGLRETLAAAQAARASRSARYGSAVG